jgi:hypothetical protein
MELELALNFSCLSNCVLIESTEKNLKLLVWLYSFGGFRVLYGKNFRLLF